MWINDIPSIVLTKVKTHVNKKLLSKYPDLTYTTSSRQRDEPKFPTVIFKKLQGQEIGRTLDGIDVNGVLSSIQIDVIDNGSISVAYEVTDSVIEAMKLMRYEIVGEPIADESSDTTFRTVTRFKRPIGFNDKL